MMRALHCITCLGRGGTNPPAHPSPVNPFPSNPLTVQLLIFEQQQLLWKSQIAHFVQLHFVVCENYKLLVKKALNKCAKILEKCTQRKLKALPLPLSPLILLSVALACVLCVVFGSLGNFNGSCFISLALSLAHICSVPFSIHTGTYRVCKCMCPAQCSATNWISSRVNPPQINYLISLFVTV